ncbi:Fpg/Nei family DNA glycosylase [Streptacidiphilus monticola]|uniref:DNA-(apurinic or apyrimidinic site) lyase n=1 Tax=Streptacidiphilus monticola TaxID=2161674 RepID=A0ABW1FX74_9ACTN
MPEGDSLFKLAAELRPALAGARLTRAELRVPALATADLTGRTVTEVLPRGKHLLMRLDDGWTLHSHQKMDGRWRLFRHGEPWRGGAAHQIRAVLGTASHTAVGYRLPVLNLVRTDEESTLVGHLGPDLLDPAWGPEHAEEAVRRLAAEPERPIGDALLDQRNLAGIGNVYRVELCFLRGMAPWRPVGDAPDLRRTVDLAHRLLFANRLRHGHVTTGDLRPGRRNWVYGRAHQPCLRCGTLIRRQAPTDGGDDRVTYWCPHCQPE